MTQLPERFAFSNFHKLSTPLVYGGVSYPTTEHFYQAMKTDDPERRKLIASQSSPAQAKRLGQGAWTNPKFDRQKVMQYALERKFAPGTPEARALMDYEGELVELNYWHDTYWGKCVCPKHQGEGENHLGRLIDAIREELLEL